MAENISSVGAGKDYSDYSTFEAGEQGAIASGDQTVAEGYGVVSNASTTVWSGSSFADSTARIVVRPATGEKHTGKPGTGATLEKTGGGFAWSFSGANNITCQGLEIMNDATAANFFGMSDSGTLQDILVDSCIIGMTGSSVVTVSSSSNAGSKVRLINTVGYGGGTRFFYNQAAAGKAVADFCTFKQFVRATEKVLCTNVLSMGSSAGDFNATDAASDYLVSSDTTANVATNFLVSKTDYTSYFTDTTLLAPDFSLLDTTDDGGIFGVTGLAGVPVAGITVDIIGNARDATTPDVGAFEFGAAPPAIGVIPQIMHHRQLQRRR